MPSAIITADKLPQSPITRNIKMRRHLHTANRLEVRVSVPVKLVSKQGLHLVATILAWRQTNRVHYDQINRHVGRSRLKIWGI